MMPPAPANPPDNLETPPVAAAMDACPPAAADSAHSPAHWRTLALHAVDRHEAENARLARLLHDELGGLLTAMKLELARMRRVPGSEVVVERASAIDNHVKSGIAMKRRIVEQLRPSALDQLGLAVALEGLGREAAAACSTAASVQVYAPALSPERPVALTIYRIAQEALAALLPMASAGSGASATGALPRVDLHLESMAGGGVRLRVEGSPISGLCGALSGDLAAGAGVDPAEAATLRFAMLQLRAEAQGGCLRRETRPDGGCVWWTEFPGASAAPA